MQKLKKSILTLPIAALLLLGMSTVAYAESSSSGGAEPADNSACDNVKKDMCGNTTSYETTDSQETQKTEDTNKTEAHNLLKDLRTAHKEHTAEQRKKNCTAAKDGLEKKLSNLGKNAAKYKTRVDNVFTKAQNYQKNNNVTVDNWDALVTAATDAQTKAAASVAALQSLDVNLDCSASNVADNVATFRTAAKQARDDLKSYKMAVKDLVKALIDAKGTTSSPNASSNSTEGAQ